MFETNKIFFGDCLEYMKSIPNESVDLVVTDPPYLYLNHKLDRAFNEELFFQECFRILKKDSILCYFGRGASFFKWGYINQNLGFEFLEEIIWDKSASSCIFSTLLRTHEQASVWRKGNKQLNKVHIDKLEYDENSKEFQKTINDAKRILSDLVKINTFDDFQKWKTETKEVKSKHGITGAETNASNRGLLVLKSYRVGKVLNSIIRVNREHYNYEHPTQKPVKLFELLVKLCSNENEIVFDPFLGSGTTALACIETNRKYIGCEIDEEYYKVIEKRINNVESVNKNKLFEVKNV